MNKLICNSALVIAFLILAVQARAQPNASYLATINEAELLITDSLFAEALAKYKQAFKIKPTASANAYYNASVCATLAGQKKDALAYLTQLSCKGIAFQEVENAEVFAPLKSTKEWIRFSRAYDSSAKKCASKINQSYRDTLLVMVSSDQYYHKIRA